MRITANLLSLMLVVLLMISANAKAQDTSGTNHKGHSHNMEMMNDSTMHKMMMNDIKMHSMDNMNMSKKKMNKDKNVTKDSRVREGEIDLQLIDENKDGFVYQDLMDLNIISDNPGKCPLCGMTLKKVSLEKAKDTLIKNGFKVK